MAGCVEAGCSNNGKCDPLKGCFCFDGFTGEDCSEKIVLTVEVIEDDSETLEEEKDIDYYEDLYSDETYVCYDDEGTDCKCKPAFYGANCD